MDVSIDVTNFLILWSVAFLLGFLPLFLPLFILIRRKKIKYSFPTIFTVIVFFFIASLSGILVLFLANYYVNDFNKKEEDKLLLKQTDFINKMVNQFSLIKIVKDSQQKTIKVIYGVPRNDNYNLHIFGTIPKDNSNAKYNQNFDELVIKENIYGTYLAEGENVMMVKIQNSEILNQHDNLDLIFIINPVNQKDKFSETQKSIVIKYPRKIDLQEGIIYFSPNLIDGCSFSGLSCIPDNRLRLAI